jgi:hypothetical protein
LRSQLKGWSTRCLLEEQLLTDSGVVAAVVVVVVAAAAVDVEVGKTFALGSNVSGVPILEWKIGFRLTFVSVFVDAWKK